MVALGLGTAVGLAVWRPPPHESTLAIPGPLVPDGPALDVGTVTFAPPQNAPVFARRHFWLSLAELERHVTLIGTTGSGKTTSIGRVIDTALDAGLPVLVVDAKGGRLASMCQAIGASHAAPFRIWLPGHPDSWTYDICAGEPTAIANRIVGAFEHGRDGQVYRNLSQALVPLAAQALLNAGRACTLDTLRYSLDEAHLTGLARHEADVAIRTELVSMLQNKLHRETLSGIAGRLRALRFGVFGASLLPSDRTLDLTACLAARGVSYLGLPAHRGVGGCRARRTGAHSTPETGRLRRALVRAYAAGADRRRRVRVARRSRSTHRSVASGAGGTPGGDRLHPASAKDPLLRKALLSAGVFVVHQTVSEDKELVARTLGSRSGTEVVRQFQFGPFRQGRSAFSSPPRCLPYIQNRSPTCVLVRLRSVFGPPSSGLPWFRSIRCV